MMVEEKGAVLAAMGDLAIRGNILAANLHAFFSVGFGSSLIISGIMDRDSTSPSYILLQETPYWPIGMGLVFCLAGITLSLANLYRVHPTRYRLLLSGFLVEGIAASLYAILFTIGTFMSSSTILGPQWVYGIVAALALSRAVYAVKAIQIAQRLGD
jgi:hypothetical protein